MPLAGVWCSFLLGLLQRQTDTNRSWEDQSCPFGAHRLPGLCIVPGAAELHSLCLRARGKVVVAIRDRTLAFP